MTSRQILVSGAGPAGLAFALLAARRGDRVRVVERASQVRGGGYAVDLRGEALGVADGLGLLDRLRHEATGMRGVHLLDAAGSVVEELATERFGGDLEVPKPALTTLLAEIAATEVDLVFDDTITALDDDGERVHVSFERAEPLDVDLVVGADGVWSPTRRVVFGPHERFARHLGVCGVGFTTSNWLDLDHQGVLRPAPGATLYAFSGHDRTRMTVSLSFATSSAVLARQARDDQEAAVRAAFAHAGWHLPRLLEDMREASDWYFASTDQIVMDQWSRGRVVLLGDAGYCAAPTSGMGTSQAFLGAHHLTRALSEHVDHEAAFADYEAELRPFVTANQSLGAEAAAQFGRLES